MGGLTRQVSSQDTATIDDIYGLVNATLILQETGGELTTDGTEQYLYVVSDPIGVFRPVCVFVDLGNMVGGDTVVFRTSYRIDPTGAMRLTDYASYTGIDGGLADSVQLIVIDLYPNRFGVQVTIQRTAGADKDYPWSVFEEA